MLTLRHRDARGRFDHGWLKTSHTFSFGEYYDSRHTSFRALRVMNEDYVLPGHGFGMHGHRDMEILTFVLAGELEHTDNLGHRSVIRPGDVQRMTAGRGIRHGEANPSGEQTTHLYQVWLTPRATGLTPSYGEKTFDPAGRRDQWQQVASPDGANGSLVIEQDARVFQAELSTGTTLARHLASNRFGWLQVLTGSVRVNDQELQAGDGLAVAEEPLVEITATSEASLLWFDLN